jgi:hypothetical protein
MVDMVSIFINLVTIVMAFSESDPTGVRGAGSFAVLICYLKLFYFLRLSNVTGKQFPFNIL